MALTVPGAFPSPWPQGEGPRAGQDHLSLKTPVETEGHTQTGLFWVNTSFIHNEINWSKWLTVHAIDKVKHSPLCAVILWFVMSGICSQKGSCSHFAVGG